MSRPDSYPSESTKRSGLRIAAGLTVVLLAQLWPAVPIATAIMMVGCGAAHLVEERVRRGMIPIRLALLQMMVYGLLVCLAIGSQWDLALTSVSGVTRPVVAVDTALAVVGMALAVCRIAAITTASR